MHFDLFFPSKERHVIDAVQVAYVCLVDSYKCDSFVLPPDGIDLITAEATSAGECCRQIDGLIEELETLKVKARRDFSR